MNSIFGFHHWGQKMLAISRIFISKMVYLITFFVTQSWSWEITNILHLWGMARPMKCYQYYYTIPNDIVPEENCHVKKKNILLFHILSCMCRHEVEYVFTVAGL